MKKSAYGLILILSLGGNFACSLFGNPFNPQDPEASRAITEFDAQPGALETSYRGLHLLIRDDPQAAARAALTGLETADPAQRFAALYTLANTASTDEQLEALRRLLASEVLSERVLAAEALLVRGDKEALPVLIAALDSGKELENSLPPQTAWGYAQNLLLQYTVEDFGLASADSLPASSAVQPAWQAWWDANGAALAWHPDEGVFR